MYFYRMKRNLLTLSTIIFIFLSYSSGAQDTIIVNESPEIIADDSLYYQEDSLYYEDEYYDDEPVPGKNTGYIGMLKAGMQFSFPSGDYRKRTVRSGVGFDLGYIGSTKNKNFFVGGGFTYHFYDSFNTQYIENDSEGFLSEFDEWVYNQQFGFYADGRYMPDISKVFQPYLSAQVGLRYRYSQVTLQNTTRDNTEDSFVHEKTWVMQYGVGLGCIIRIKNLMFEISGTYLEAQAGSHLLRLPDWRTVDATYSTDIYKTYREPIQEMILHVGMIFLID
jgi:hypothetical protein